MAKHTGIITPVGTLKYAHIHRPDTKFSVDGVFKADLILKGAEAVALKTQIDAACQKAFDEELVNPANKLTAIEKKQALIYRPYEDLYDDKGEPTGETCFKTKQAAKLKLKDGSVKDITISIKDSADKPLAKGVEVWAGSRARLLVVPRNVVLHVMKPLRIGVQLALSGVQVVELKSGGGGGASFGAIEGGYVGGAEDNDAEAGEEASFSSSSAAATTTSNSDY